MPQKGSTTEKGLRTRQRILDAATDLFHAQGVNATSIGDVLRASDTGKGQFYQHFSGLDDLRRTVLDTHREYVVSGPDINSWDDLANFLQAHIESQVQSEFTRGCPIGTAAYSVQPDQHANREILRQTFASQIDKISDFLQREQVAGRFEKDADTSALATLAIAATQGGMLLSLVEGNDRAVTSAVELAMHHLHQSTIDLTEA